MEIIPATGGARPPLDVLLERVQAGRIVPLLADRDLSRRMGQWLTTQRVAKSITEIPFRPAAHSPCASHDWLRTTWSHLGSDIARASQRPWGRSQFP